MTRNFAILAGMVLVLVATGLAADPQAGSLADAPANTWVKAQQGATGGREQPVFVYVPSLKKFVMATGMQATGGVVPRHYDTEEFDLATGKWINAYPGGLASTRPESGPVGEEYSKKRMMMGNSRPEFFYKDGEFLRLGAGGQWLETRTGYEWCAVPETGRVYLYLRDMTLCYDAARRTWADLGAKPRTSNRIWGSLVYDPVNKEIVHAGGDGGSAEIGTWAYSIDKNEWRKLELTDAARQPLLTRARELRWQAKALLGAAVNRFTVAETKAEASADLKAKAAELKAAADTLNAEVGKLAKEQEWAARAAGFLTPACETLSEVGPKLGGGISPELIATLRAARVMFEQAADALAIEPPGRARSQVAYDPERQKIVLFGGDHLDRTLADTWLYDCKTRTWEQRFPKACPLPRAGHILAWLPKAKRVVLAGGYSREPLAQEVWTYDAAGNEWKLLAHAPLGKPDSEGRRASGNGPPTDARTTQVGAVTEDDVLVCVPSGRGPLATWACKIDAGKTIEIPAGQAGTPGQYSFNRIDPAAWEKAANPDAAATRKFHDAMPANQWTALKFAKYAPGATNRWGTTAYDPDRHQLLFWGGGHATSHENDVAHFSMLGSCWTLGYHPDDPIETVYAAQPTPVSFEDRAHVPVHAYKGYCYDQTAGLMLYFDRAYDVAAREWRPGQAPGLKHKGTMHSQMAPTPRGAATYSAEGLFRFDAKAGQWNKLPWDGPNPGGIWCDGDSLVYDSKRDCLWLGTRKDIYRYDLASGKAEKVQFSKPKALGEFALWGEDAYLPDDDLILLMRLFKRPDGTLSNVVWSPSDGKYYWAAAKFVADGKDVTFPDNPFSWHDALHYDTDLKLLVLNNSSARRVWAMKFDRKAANLEEMKD